MDELNKEELDELERISDLAMLMLKYKKEACQTRMELEAFIERLLRSGTLH